MESTLGGTNYFLIIFSDSVRACCIFVFIYQYIEGDILTRFENIYYDYGLGLLHWLVDLVLV